MPHEFGTAVALNGDRVVVGAARDDDLTGAVYVFERNQGGVDAWGEVAKLTASDADLGHRFGEGLEFAGDTLVVGALRAPGAVLDAGAAYLLERSPYAGGDCNLDGAGPDILDALEAALITAGLVTPQPVQQVYCDADASGTVSILDALRIAQFAVGLPVTLTCP